MTEVRVYKFMAMTIKNGQYYSTTETVEAYDREEAIAQFNEKMLILYEPPRTPRHIFAYGRDVEFTCEPPEPQDENG